ncbi:MAG: Maf family protein [Clostridia bacterium]|nr:Maf family protein [Clostridia bacterium]
MELKVNRKIILASGSPRRRELLEKLGLQFEVVKSEFDESTIENKNPKKLVMKLAESKADEVSRRDDITSDSLIISADTIVVFKNEILGKPKDDLDAMRMLKLLNNQKHQVYTAMCIIDMKKMNKKVVLSKSDVFFDKVSDEKIMEYVKSGEPSDKAGAYAIQGDGSVFIKKINGDYFSIMGLSINQLYKELSKIK